MIIDNIAGRQFFLNEDIYLLKQDIGNLHNLQADITERIIEEPVIAEQPAVVAEPAALYFNNLGGNAKQFLILCSYPEAEQMDDKHLEALKSALSRKQLALDDVAILNLSKHATATIDDLWAYFKPTRLLILGAPALLAGWDKFALNQLQNLNGIKVLYTYSFGEMLGDRDKTKAFWEQMKVL